jgi:cellulose synthase/poly-beta-1,6-N-acetylglucosamine synthase-like glycosyltransferase
VQLIPNPARLQAAAFNRALELARGEYLVRIDAHATIPADYLATCVATLRRTSAVNVGGPIVSVGTGTVGSAIAAAYGSRFGLGHGRHDPNAVEHEVDSVSFGAWQAGPLRQVGGMNPAMAINEDFELNYRLRAAGHRVVWHPQIRAEYQVRGSLRALARQYFRYGFWKVKTLMMHPGSLRARQLVAPLFVLSLLATPALVYLFGWLGAAHLIAYAMASVAASVGVARASAWRHMLLLPLIFLVIHLSWGVGFILGGLYWPFRDHAAA